MSLRYFLMKWEFFLVIRWEMSSALSEIPGKTANAYPLLEGVLQ